MSLMRSAVGAVFRTCCKSAGGERFCPSCESSAKASRPSWPPRLSAASSTATARRSFSSASLRAAAKRTASSASSSALARSSFWVVSCSTASSRRLASLLARAAWMRSSCPRSPERSSTPAASSCSSALPLVRVLASSSPSWLLLRVPLRSCSSACLAIACSAARRTEISASPSAVASSVNAPGSARLPKALMASLRTSGRSSVSSFASSGRDSLLWVSPRAAAAL